jgi:S-adenosylmethionine:tRNA ribosyltransferase-isomerase
MLVVGETQLDDSMVREWPELVPEGSLVVLNDTRVIKARVFAQRVHTGGRVELLFLRPCGDEPSRRWLVLGRANRPLGPGARLVAGDVTINVVNKRGDGEIEVECSAPVDQLLEASGHVPLPPYVRRADEPGDLQRYQTVFARHPGSAAAPTAGLHLTERALLRLHERGVQVGHVTLHVGSGTFRPVTAETLEEHRMHTEHYQVSEQLVQSVGAARSAGRPVIAVGTTVVRALESAAAGGSLVPQNAGTHLMIAPGYRFSVVDALLTNFHAPRSTLLALVYAFSGTARVRQAYAHALRSGYRFLSYGDAMWLPRRLS